MTHRIKLAPFVLLALFAFQTLPVSYAGVLLILLALVLFIAEIKIVSHGMLTVGGVVAMTFGSLLLFQSPEPYLRISTGVILASVAMMTLFFAVVVDKAFKAQQRPPVTGREGMIGETGIAETLGIALGDRLAFEVSGQRVEGTVQSLREVQWDSFNANFFVIGTPALLGGQPATYITSFHLPPARLGLLAELAHQFPSVTV